MSSRSQPGSRDGATKTVKKAKTARKAVGDNAAALQIEQLNSQIAQLQGELDQSLSALKSEKEQRNYFQLERDKIYSLYETTLTRATNAESSLRTKELEMESLTATHQSTIKVYQQKIKELLYSAKHEATQLKTEAEQSLRGEEEENRKREAQIQEEKRILGVRLKEETLKHMETVRNINEENERNVSNLREQFEERMRQAQRNFDLKLQGVREDCEVRRKEELSKLEERKNTHIQRLIANHRKSFEEIKQYYNDIIKNNLELVKSLKEELAEVRKREAMLEKVTFDVEQENKRLSDPLREALEETALLKQRLEAHERTTQSLDIARSKIDELERKLKATEWEQTVQLQRFQALEEERDELYSKFESAVADVEERAVFREVLLEKRLKAANEQLETQEAQLAEVLEAAGLEPAVLEGIHARLAGMLEAKDRRIRELSFELVRLMRLHNEALRVFGSRLESFGVPKEELEQFKPFDLSEGGGISAP